MPLKVTTLKKRTDFLRLNRGKKHVAPYFILRQGPGEEKACRVGYTVTTKCGNAVVRNKIKRKLREAVRVVFPKAAKAGTDYVIIARADVKPSVSEATLEDLKAALIKALA